VTGWGMRKGQPGRVRPTPRHRPSGVAEVGRPRENVDTFSLVRMTRFYLPRTWGLSSGLPIVVTRPLPKVGVTVHPRSSLGAVIPIR
jgi:hypothetical protein